MTANRLSRRTAEALPLSEEAVPEWVGTYSSSPLPAVSLDVLPSKMPGAGFPLGLWTEPKLFFHLPAEACSICGAFLPKEDRLKPVAGIGPVAFAPSIPRRGNLLAYVHPNLNSSIWQIRLSDETHSIGPATRLITSRGHVNWRPDFSPDGKKVVFESDHLDIRISGPVIVTGPIAFN